MSSCITDLRTTGHSEYLVQLVFQCSVTMLKISWILGLFSVLSWGIMRNSKAIVAFSLLQGVSISHDM